MQTSILQTQNLKHSYGKIAALRSISLAVPPRSIFGFLGPNGAGKTTAIRCIMGLIRANSGTITINGHNIRKERRGALSGVGAVVETPALYPNLTGQENLELARLMIGAPKSAVERVLEIVEMRQHAARKISQYSLGMRQRLGLARALLGSPSLLVLDEPTNGLDPSGIVDMRNLIRSLPEREGTTVFMSSHLLSEIENTASHVALLKQGRLAFQGPLRDLMAKREHVFHLGVDQPDLAAKIALRLGYANISKSDDGLDISLPAGTPSQNQAILNAALVKEGVAVHELRRKSADLEAIFLQLTAGQKGEQA